MSEQWIRFEFYLKCVKLVFQRPFVSIEAKVGDQQYTLISKLCPNQKNYQTVNEKIIFDVLMTKNQKSQWIPQMLLLEFLCEENIFAQCSINLTSYITQSTVVETLEIEPNLAIKYQITLQLLDENDSQKHMSESHLKLLTETLSANDNSYTKQYQLQKDSQSQLKKRNQLLHSKAKTGLTPQESNVTPCKQVDGFVKNYKGLYKKKNYEEQKQQSSGVESSNSVSQRQDSNQDPLSQVVSRLQKEPFLDVVQSTNMYIIMKELQQDKLQLKNQLIGLRDSNQILQVKVDSLEIDLIDLKNLTSKIINNTHDNLETPHQHPYQNQQIITQLKTQLNSLMEELERTKVTQSREKELVKYIEDQKILISSLRQCNGERSECHTKSVQTQLSGLNIDQMILDIQSRDQVNQQKQNASEKEIKDLFLQYQNSMDSLAAGKLQQISPIKNRSESANKTNSDQIEILEAQLDDYEHQMEAYKQENKQLKANFMVFKQDMEQRHQAEIYERSVLEVDICTTKQRLGDVLNLCFQSGHGELIDQINSALN